MRTHPARWISIVVGAVVAVSVFAGCAEPAAAPSHSRAGPSSPATRSASADPPDQRPIPFPTDLPSGAPRGLTPAEATVDRGSADAVAEAFVVRLELMDTRLDHRPNDAARRAAAYATPRLGSRLLSNEPIGAPGVRWTELVRHHGWSTVASQLGGIGEATPTTATSATRAVTPIPTDHGDDGWISHPDPPGTYIVVLNRTPGGKVWTVSSYTIQ